MSLVEIEVSVLFLEWTAMHLANAPSPHGYAAHKILLISSLKFLLLITSTLMFWQF